MTAKSARAPITLLMIAVGAFALLIGDRLVPHTTPRSVEPAAHVDAAMTRFRALIDRDMMAINFPFDKSSGCRSRQVCTAELVQTRSASEALLVDLAATPAPKVFVQADVDMTIAARQFIDQLDVALTALQQPSGDYLAVSGIPRSYSLRLAAAAVDCWPRKSLGWDQTDNLGDNAGIPCA